MKLELSLQISKNTEMSIFMNICPVGAEFFQADGRTDRKTDRRADMMKPIVAFRNFANAPKMHVNRD